MRRDRTGEEMEDAPEAHVCRGGWLGEDADGNPIPCLKCKPHLEPSRRRYRAGIDPYPPAEPKG